MGGGVSSNLHDEHESPAQRAAFDAIESMVLAHALAAVDVASPAYLEGIETAVDAITNELDEVSL